ncbi:MAG TPA: FAD-dependent monooxygenase [Solirubrobacteraceae bacterium]|nr:FAD-dependent monooxygenase [Solirubrobacteraceae bacterium]
MAPTDPRPLRVAVVGAGIGGLTAALALVHAGIEVTVYEQTPVLSELGAQFSIGPNAIRLLGALGVLESLRRIGVRPDAVEHLRWDDGSVLIRAPLGERSEAFFGAPQLDFLRSDLQHALAGELPAGVVRTGARVAALEQDSDGVDILLDGGERVRVDAAVAADGIRSSLRQDLVGADAPLFSGTVVYRGLVRRELAAPLQPALVARYWVGPERHGVAYWVASGNLLGIAAAVRRAQWSRESWTDPGDPEEMLAAFEGWHPPLLELMGRCHTLIRSPVFVREPLERWSHGRITLLGDAAHAMEPFNAQGAAQAIEDAFVLGECLAGVAPDGAAEAFLRYERARTVRAGELQAASAAAALEFYLPDGPAQRERDARYATLLETEPWGMRQNFWRHDVRDDLAAVP